jgi:Kae1-associated kinase Bud32
MRIAQGAEAIIDREGDIVTKYRLEKPYRIPILDKRLRKSRTRREAKVLDKLFAAQIPAPKLLSVDDKRMEIKMSFIPGSVLADSLEENPVEYATQIGHLLAKLHAQNIIHGDLTTSNMIVHKDVVHLIDFGLSYFSLKVEDKAVDLEVLHRALGAKHFGCVDGVWDQIIATYQTYDHAKDVLARLEKVELRGRHKQRKKK